MYRTERKVYLLISLRRRVGFPAGVDFTSIEGFKQTLDFQTDKNNRNHLVYNPQFDTLQHAWEIPQMLETFEGKLLKFRHAICKGTIVLEVSFQNPANAISFLEYFTSYPSISGRHVITLTLPGSNVPKIYQHDLNHYNLILGSLSPAANNDFKGFTDGAKMLYTNLSSIITIIRDAGNTRKVEDIRVLEDHVEIDVSFRDYNESVKFESMIRTILS